MSAIQTTMFAFHGDEILIVQHEGDWWVPMKRIAENLGLDWRGQQARLQSQRRRWRSGDISIPSEGGPQRMVCMPRRKLSAWLASVNSTKVRADLRPKLERYQDEIDDAIDAYVRDGFAVRPGLAEPSRPAPADSIPPGHRPEKADGMMLVPVADYVELLKARIRDLERAAQPRRQPYRPITQEEIARWRHCREVQGMSNAAIARQFGRGDGTISSYLKQH